ncbi:MAG: hypothetical protein J6N72_06860 [Psychrobacter sp.]|nr:hypothetical protein [Psychrobacter sp.]
MNKLMNKTIFLWVLTMVSIDAMAAPPNAFQGINQSATVDNVAANSQAFLGNLFEFFVNLGLVAGIIVGFMAGLKMKRISSGEEQSSYAGPIVMLMVAGGLTSVWFVVFVFSNTVESLAG